MSIVLEERHIFSTEISSAHLKVLKTLNRYLNFTHFGRLWLYLRCRSVFIVIVLF